MLSDGLYYYLRNPPSPVLLLVRVKEILVASLAHEALFLLSSLTLLPKIICYFWIL